MSIEYRLRKQKQLLDQFTKIQPTIALCYRPTQKHSWADRCVYKDDKYETKKLYNHRTILDNEIVIEYDSDDVKLNRKYVNIVSKRLDKENIPWAKWISGNKSTHLSFMVDTKDAKNVSLLKNAIIRVFTNGLPLPDMRLTAKHMIRCEYGVHEKTGHYKTPVNIKKGYPRVCNVPKKAWDKYTELMERVTKWKTTMAVRDLSDSDEVKLILDTVRFKELRDGRERALFMLIHLLKPKYVDKPKELTAFLTEWYRYSGGYKLTDNEISSKIKYHFGRSYNIGIGYINTFLEELGVKVDTK